MTRPLSKRPKPLDAGTVVQGRYEIEGMLGQGGFGAVYRARQLATGQAVAIKVMNAAASVPRGEDPRQIAARLEREAQLIARLQHPNIVGLIDSGSLEEQRIFLVLEFIDGVTLSQLVAQTGGLPLRLALRIMTQVLEALAFAHARGIVHRDLKPQNIMVSEPEHRANAVVLDFGIAKLVDDARGVDYRSLTGEDQLPGTPAYMAPEQLQRGRLSGASDLYAWGLVFLECVMGRPVLDPDQGVIPTLFWQLSDEPVPLPGAVLGSPLEPILRRATAKSLDERYTNAEDLLQDLERLQLQPAELDALEHALRDTRSEPTLDANLGVAQALAAVGASARPPSEPASRARPASLDEPQATIPELAAHAAAPPPPALPPAPPTDYDATLPAGTLSPLAGGVPAPEAGSRRGLLLALLALGAVGALGALAWVLLAGGPRDEPAPDADGGAATSATATLTVQALEPDGAEILLDGRRLGRAAGRFEGLATGPAVIVVRAADHEARVAEVELAPGAEVDLGRVALTPLAQPTPIDMVHVPAGAFWRGCDDETERLCGDDERPGSRVEVGAFFIDRTEVTVAAYRTCVEAGACEPAAITFPGAPDDTCNAAVAGRDHFPINCVTWAQARAYCGWVGKRLPTEAEWEKAARGTDRRHFPWGNQSADCTLAVMAAEDGRDGCGTGLMEHVYTRPAGASPYGALNMSGNADEWVADHYAPDAYRQALEAGQTRDPSGPETSPLRTSRGGGFDDDLVDMRAAARDSESPTELDNDQGFRCAR